MTSREADIHPDLTSLLPPPPPAHQVERVEDLQFPNAGAARVGQVAEVAVHTEGTDAARVGRRVAYGVNQLHVADVVDVERLLQADHQTLAEGRADSELSFVRYW